MTRNDGKTVEEIVKKVKKQFRTFGGGEKDNPMGNPIVAAMEDKPLMFAMGVNVEEVVNFVILETIKPFLETLEK